MSSGQLQKRHGDDDDAKAKTKETTDDTKAKSAIERAKEVLAKAAQKPERKGGRYVSCCGIRTWVSD